MVKSKLRTIIKEEINSLLKEIRYEDLETINSWEDLKKTFSKFKHDLKYLQQYKGEDQNNLLGSGGTGKVFRIGNTNKAIKISIHSKDYKVCKKLIDQNPKHLIKIYESKYIKNPQSHVYLIIMEYCSPLPTEIFNLINKYEGEIDSFLSGEKPYLRGEEIEFESEDQSLVDKYNFDIQILNIKKELDQYKVLSGGPGGSTKNWHSTDARSSNFLINSLGNICFVDIVNPFN